MRDVMVVCQASPFLVLAGENDMKFDKLEQNIIDMIKEEQAKLGYRREISACIILSVPWSI